MSKSVRERLLSRLIIEPETGCLLWTGGRSDGYGRIKIDGKPRQVHQVMYEMFADPIPDGLVPDHLCRVRHCASLAHLEYVTRRVNALRGESFSAVNAVKTHCDSGHEYDLLNTYWTPDNKRRCRACDRDNTARYKARKKMLAC